MFGSLLRRNKVDTAEYRHEFKAAITTADPELVKCYIDTHSFLFRDLYPDRWVNSIYFDTYALEALDDNELGSALRHKLRLRWYGPLEKITGPILEVKIKKGIANRKIKESLPRFSHDLKADPISWSDFMEKMKSGLSPEAIYNFEQFTTPVLLCRYRRSYYQSACKRVRLTVDQNIQFFDQRFADGPDLATEVDTSGRVVVEFKFENEDEELTSEVFQQFPFLLTKSSKYRDGYGYLNRSFL